MVGLVLTAVGTCLGMYSGFRIGQYVEARRLYNTGRVEENPTIFNSPRILKKYTKNLNERIDFLEGENYQIRRILGMSSGGSTKLVD